MSKLVEKAVSFAASASAVASYLRKKLTEKEENQIIELYSDEEAKKHASETAIDESYLEVADGSEETTIMNYAPKTISSGVPLVMERLVDIENDTDDVESLMFSYPLEFEEEEARPAPMTVFQAEPDTIPEDREAEEATVSGFPYEEDIVEEEPEIVESEDEEELESEEEEYEEEIIEEEEETESEEETYEEDSEEEEEFETEDEEYEEEVIEEEEEAETEEEEPDTGEEAEDSETSLEKKLEVRIIQVGDIGYKGGIKDAPVEEDIIEPNVDAIMAATKVADETIEEIVRDIEKENMTAADIDRELGRNPFEDMDIEVVRNQPSFNTDMYTGMPEGHNYMPDIDVANMIDEAVEGDMQNASFVDNIDSEADQLADLTRRVVELSNVNAAEEPVKQPAEPNGVDNVLNDNTQNLFQEINSISAEEIQSLTAKDDVTITAPVTEQPAVVETVSEEKMFPHLTDSRISKISNQVDSMLEALGNVERIYLKHYAIFNNYSDYWNFKKAGESLGYEVTDMNDRNEAYMYKEYEAERSLLLPDILSLADSLRACQGNYRGWKVMERSDNTL